VLLLDSEGKERARREGYLPNKDFVAALMSGLGRIAFVQKKYSDAEQLRIESVNRVFALTLTTRIAASPKLASGIGTLSTALSFAPRRTKTFIVEVACALAPCGNIGNERISQLSITFVTRYLGLYDVGVR
jgi:hypothetical protein